MHKHQCDLEISMVRVRGGRHVFAIRISPNGRFRSFSRQVDDGTEKMWVFIDLQTWQDTSGGQRIDEQLDELRCGDVAKGERFIETLEDDYGIVVRPVNFHVPFICGRPVDTSNGFVDSNPWPDYEVALVRMDMVELVQRITEVASLDRTAANIRDLHEASTRLVAMVADNSTVH